MGPRAHRRPSPRFGVTLAGAGGLLMALGVIVLGADATDVDDFSGESNNTVGIVLSLLAMVGGFTLLTVRRTGPLAGAGAAAAALALPAFLSFATLDLSSSSLVSQNVVLGISTLGWAAAYVVGRGRGHSLFLTLALLGALGFVLNQVQSSGLTGPDGFGPGPVIIDDPFFGPQFGFERPSFWGLAITSLLFGVAYCWAGRRVDRLDLRGIGTPLHGAGIAALALSLFYLAFEVDILLVGFAAILQGCGLLWLGAAGERRGTNWWGGIAVVVGIFLILGDTFDSATTGGAALLVAGVLLAIAAELVGFGLGETDEADTGPSPIPGANPGPGTPAQPF